MGRGGNQDNILYGDLAPIREKASDKTDVFALGHREIVVQNDRRVFNKKVDLNSEVIIEKQVVEQKKISPTNVPNIFHVDSPDSAFYRQEDIEECLASDDPYSQLLNKPIYSYLSDKGAEMLKNGCKAEDLFSDQPGSGSWSITDLQAFADKETVNDLLKNGKLEEERIVFFNDYDYSLWQANRKLPMNTIHHAELGASDYNLNQAEEHLKSHPWVKSIVRQDVPYYNRESLGSESLQVKLLTDEETWQEIATKLSEDPNNQDNDYKGYFSIPEITTGWEILKRADIDQFRR